jgi:hypothetical protein
VLASWAVVLSVGDAGEEVSGSGGVDGGGDVGWEVLSGI